MIGMRVGHLDGRGVVYDEGGMPLLQEDETILKHVPGDNLSVSEASSLWNMRSFMEQTAEKGDLFLTSQRLIFIRRPDPFLAAKDDAYPLGMADAVAKAYKARTLKSKGVFEFCEISLAEVDGFWVRRNSVGVLFLGSPRNVTRKAVMYRRGPNDDKFAILHKLLSQRLPETEPEDRKGSFLLGARYPFRGRPST